MQEAKIVIGLGYGDEGKGITTDFLCGKYPNSIVIRFSGGQQAAHTVFHKGIKHVHSSFTSGTLRNCPSYFSEHCTIHPTFLYNEYLELKEKGINPKLYIHPLAKVTTPFDVWHNINNNKNLKHGTCGKGVGATMKRNEGPYKLYAIDLIAPENFLIEKLKAIALYYGMQENEFLTEKLTLFLDNIKKIKWNIINYEFLKTFKTLIFEGSQGILLDMHHGIFPNVTYANTTSKNAYEICNKLNISNIENYYVTRSYLSRHGAGWMQNEDDIILKNNESETCTYNEYQKELRIGELDIELLEHALKIDGLYSKPKNKNLVITCLDQRNIKIDFSTLFLLFNKIYGSYSPDSKDFKNLSKTN